ncbi:MAG: hypothetical protein H6708_04640 [Kofleriaceae bacterium]|nr:hypothetical protein [Kofleriaceae bacterium]
MRLVGDTSGVAALKDLVADHRDYLKFLISEARTNSDHLASFRDKGGARWQLVLHADSGDIEIRPTAS